MAAAVAALAVGSTVAAAPPPEARRVTCYGVTDSLWHHAGVYADVAGIRPAILRALVTVESNWNGRAVSAAGAEGLAQIMPAHHPRMTGRTFDECASLHYAAWLLAWLTSEREGDLFEASRRLPCGSKPSAGRRRVVRRKGRGSGAPEGGSGRMSDVNWPALRLQLRQFKHGVELEAAGLGREGVSRLATPMRA